MKVFGTPRAPSARRVLMLGSGELGKEVVLELMRLGVEVIACDRYENAPAMQVAHASRVFNMLDAEALRAVVEEVQPELIVPEVEAIATPELERLEHEGWTVIPTAEATRLTMDREGIRRLAAEELDLPTAPYRFADTFDEFEAAAKALGFPCVVKPIMSSSGKGQSLVASAGSLESAWNSAQGGGRAGEGRVIVEGFIDFESEITLLTVRTVDGTLFCDPVGHRQDGGDYVESWQPHAMGERQLERAQAIARAVTDRLGGLGVFGVELFLLRNGDVMFSEVSPRPHDTGMVTMATQTWSEFALHARAILGLPIQAIRRHAAGASVAVRASEHLEQPAITGVEAALSEPDVDVRLFGKPKAYPRRRMAVVLGADAESATIALERAKKAAAHITVGEAL